MKYAGLTRKQIRQVIKQSRKTEEGLDSILGDDAIACNLVEDLLNHIKELTPKKEKEVEAKSTAKKSKAKESSKKKAPSRKKGGVLKFPFGN